MGIPFNNNIQYIKVNAFSLSLTAIPSKIVQVAIKAAVVVAMMKANLLNFLAVKKDIKNNPKQIKIIPKIPAKLISAPKIKILTNPIIKTEPPLAIGYTKDRSPY